MNREELINALRDYEIELIEKVMLEHPEVDWDNDVYEDYSDYDPCISAIEEVIESLEG